MSSQYPVPATPRVISPSPTPSEVGSKDGYFPPTKPNRFNSVEPIEEHTDSHEDQDNDDNHGTEDPELSRARPRTRPSQLERKPTRQQMMNGGGVTTSATTAKAGMPSAAASKPVRRRKEDTIKPPNGDINGNTNGLLSPASAYPQGYGSSYWRNLSRSPSPLGLIPIHREWRAFVHKHEVPRKLLHVSIGFFTLFYYTRGVQAPSITPLLLTLFFPILFLDLLRFRWPAFNRLYIKVMGPFMRESEAHDQFNGVIMYIAGLWFPFQFCRKDVAAMSVLLLSWCDTAASTFGRLWGKYTPRIRRGKSLAGSLAAFVVGVGAAVLWWGVIGPYGVDPKMNTGINSFAFQGHLTLPSQAREALGLSEKQASISGPLALGVLSVISGLAASVSEAIDLWGLDDNLTIPVLSGMELGAFLWAFGGTIE